MHRAEAGYYCTVRIKEGGALPTFCRRTRHRAIQSTQEYLPYSPYVCVISVEGKIPHPSSKIRTTRQLASKTSAIPP